MRNFFIVLLGVTLWVGAGCEDRSPGGAETDCVNGLDDDGDGQVDCMDPDCEGADACLLGFGVTLYSEDLRNRGVDLLVVMDNSGGTLFGQERVRHAVGVLWRRLGEAPDGMPDLHLGLVTTDLGAGGQPLTYCEDADGDGGRLQGDDCMFPSGVPYIVDARPRGCTIDRDVLGSCATHDCTEMHCAHEPATTLQIASDGCPRCRNTGDLHPMTAFECPAAVGTQGCGFEQPLEAMYRALDNHPYNAGFLREDAHLAVILFADEDDCSVADPRLFDMTDTSLESELGPLTSFRCFEFGVRCDVEDRQTVGLWPNCAPREADDPKALLHSVDRYTALLRGLKSGEDFSVAVITPPVADEGVRVSMDDGGSPSLDHTCLHMEGGTPAVRLRAFLHALHQPPERDWALMSSCWDPVPDFGPNMQAMSARIQGALGSPCAPYPPRGCTDIAAAFGLPGDGQSCNDACVPSCMVVETSALGLPQQEDTPVVSCLETCADGPCEGNTDATAAYANGHPPALDPALPVEACWHFTYDEVCVAARGARLTVSRRADLPPRSMIWAGCQAVTLTELQCTDGADNDGDCLTDAEDPDCP